MAEYRTFRRFYLDEKMSEVKFRGKVLDVGGHQEKKRGRFRPPLQRVESWEYLNIDPSTRPDYLASADNIPLKNGTFDIVVCTEVIEHLINPVKALSEMSRVLKDSGMLVASIPLMFQVHAAPFDFQRWTKFKLHNELTEAGFSNLSICEMGGATAVVYDVVYALLTAKKPEFFRKVMLKILSSLFRVIHRFDKENPNERITTGYFVVAFKR